MSREFFEETGVNIQPADWDYFLTISGDDFNVSFFRAFTDDIYKAKTITDEIVNIIDIENDNPATISNLSWIIPLALDENVGKDFICNRGE